LIWQGGANGVKHALFRRLTLRSATGTAQRAVPTTHFCQRYDPALMMAHLKMIPEQNELMMTQLKLILTQNELMMTQLELILAQNELMMTQLKLILEQNELMMSELTMFLCIKNDSWRSATGTAQRAVPAVCFCQLHKSQANVGLCR
jgi:hypothetical protein